MQHANNKNVLLLLFFFYFSCKCWAQQANRMVSYLRSIVAFLTSKLRTHTHAEHQLASADDFISTLLLRQQQLKNCPFICAHIGTHILSSAHWPTKTHIYTLVSHHRQPPSEMSEIKPFTWRLWLKKKKTICIDIYGHKLASAAINRISYRS